MRQKLAIGTALILALAVPAFAQGITPPGANEKQLDWKKHGLDNARIGMERDTTSAKLTSADVEPILGKTLLDQNGKSLGTITAVQNGASGQPSVVHIQIGKETNSPIKKLPADTISLRNGRVMTSLSQAEVDMSAQ